MVEIKSNYDRPAQLEEFSAAAIELVSYLEEHDIYLEQVEPLKKISDRCAQLLLNGFTQHDLDELGSSFAPFVEQYREWVPPLERIRSGARVEPVWVEGLLQRHRRVRDAAFSLRVLGEY